MNEARVSCLERSARCSIGQLPEPLLEKLAGQAMGRRKYAPEAFVKVRKTHIAVFFCSRKVQYGLLAFIRISAYNKSVTFEKEARYV